jgi:hypothetical protein
MVAVDFVNVAVVISGILVLAAAVLTLVLWQEEGRRSAHHTRAQTRHTALSRRKAATAVPADAKNEDAELSA